MLYGEVLVIDPEAVEHAGIQVVDVNWVLNDVITVIVGLAVVDARLESAPCDKSSKASSVVVASVCVLRQIALAVNRPPELAAEYNNSVFEHAALLEVLDEGGCWLISTIGILLKVFF